eukprot:scaffold26661_cov60-Cyclotella_meneghiniana.AAC.5
MSEGLPLLLLSFRCKGKGEKLCVRENEKEGQRREERSDSWWVKINCSLRTKEGPDGGEKREKKDRTMSSLDSGLP